MTDKPPAMPEHRIPDELLHLCERERESVRRYANTYARAALQSAQPAEVSDEAILACIAEHEVYQGRPGALLHFARAILALRPQAVPMTDEQTCAALGIDGSDDWTYKVRDAVEAHHGITQRADGGEKQA